MSKISPTLFRFFPPTLVVILAIGFAFLAASPVTAVPICVKDSAGNCTAGDGCPPLYTDTTPQKQIGSVCMKDPKGQCWCTANLQDAGCKKAGNDCTKSCPTLYRDAQMKKKVRGVCESGAAGCICVYKFN